ncbi:10440_t:CDS:10 [Funneliformis geosporum]|uniref:21S rRNA pseudouridine(2819) synthase n=1 Tax=Funneliformis geosporum TaxID=1117311 RepID=A0A9W4SP49_9GLOM|nr:10440_t:CDS:10 [Funneliformis geosporum]
MFSLRYNICPFRRCFNSSSISKINSTSILNGNFKYHEYVVKEEDDVDMMRLDRYLHLQTKLPISIIQMKIRKNEVKLKPRVHESTDLDKDRVKLHKVLSYKVRPGDLVSIRSPDLYKEAKFAKPKRRKTESFSEKEIESIRSLILYQDKEILVINKPAGLATQGGPKTLKHVDGLLHVHRLDKNTTGTLILGRTRSAAGKLSHMFRESTIDKMYIAIVNKFLPRNLSRVKIDVPICYGGKPPYEKVTCVLDRRSILMEKAKSAITNYQVLAGTGNYSLLRLHPKTGRKHQLRSHCAYVLEASILGDYKYGMEQIYTSETPEPMYLHLSRLAIHNWRTPEGKILKQPIEITAPLPPYFKKKSELLFGIDAESTEWDY